MMTTDQTKISARSRLEVIWDGFVGLIAALVGLAPHVLHHVGLLAGTALAAGATGTILFGVIGLLASIPFLLKLHRRFGTWRAPFIALIIFAVMFSVSSFVVGPAIRGDDAKNSPTLIPADDEHNGHHEENESQ